MEQQEKQPVKTFPIANLVCGQFFDKRYLITSVDAVVEAIAKLSPEFAADIKEGKGFSLILNPITFNQVNGPEANEVNQRTLAFQQPRMLNMGMSYMDQNPVAYGGQPYLYENFGIVAHGCDRILILTTSLSGPLGQRQEVPLVFDLMIRNLRGELTGDVASHGFVVE